MNFSFVILSEYTIATLRNGKRFLFYTTSLPDRRTDRRTVKISNLEAR